MQHKKTTFYVAHLIFKSRIHKKASIAGIILCIVICTASIMPLTIASVSELSDQPERPEGIDRQMPFPGGMGPTPQSERFKELGVPPFIARKHTELMRSVQEEFRNGRLPDYFLPRETAMEIEHLFEEKKFLKAEKLIDEALRKHKSNFTKQN